MAFAGFGPVRDDEVAAAAARWWDGDAENYMSEHIEALGQARLLWCPEGLYEDSVHLLGDVSGRRVLEVGCGAASGSRWAAANGAEAVGLDLSAGMLRHARELNASTGIDVPLVQGDARAMPFADGQFDIAFTAFGAIPFVRNPGEVYREVARVLVPGGRWVCSLPHPVRYAFPDDPTLGGLTMTRSYFDLTPYVERDEAGQLQYADFPHPFGLHVRELAGAGLHLLDALEPQWDHGTQTVWGAWGPERGQYLPGTLILIAEKAAA